MRTLKEQLTGSTSLAIILRQVHSGITLLLFQLCCYFSRGYYSLWCLFLGNTHLGKIHCYLNVLCPTLGQPLILQILWKIPLEQVKHPCTRQTSNWKTPSLTQPSLSRTPRKDLLYGYILCHCGLWNTLLLIFSLCWIYLTCYGQLYRLQKYWRERTALSQLPFLILYPAKLSMQKLFSSFLLYFLWSSFSNPRAI